ncbi:DUF2079 domain-containing protein [bacterium]|nr:DUF2079 domain-containing protein [bacterium]
MQNGSGNSLHSLRPILILIAVMAILYSTYSLLRHWHYSSSGYDLGIFDQAMWHYSRFEIPRNTIADYPHILAEHFHPILLILVPFYRVLPRPEILLVLQAVLLSLSALPVYIYARSRVGSRFGFVLSLAYVLFWGIQKTVAFDFHELAFSPLLIATAILGLETRKWRLLFPALIGILLTKEDLHLLVIFFGFLLILSREYLKGILVVVFASISFAAVVTWLMPMFGDPDKSGFLNTYSEFGQGPFALLIGMISRPWVVIKSLVDPPIKIRTFLLWVGPFLFLPLISRISILAVPLVLARFLSSSPNHWTAGFHYSAPLAPILAMAAADGLRRVLDRIHPEILKKRVAVVAVTFILLMCAILPGKLPVWRLLSPKYYHFSDVEKTGPRALSLIPESASVVAQDGIVPHLSRRDFIYTLRPGAPEADFVVASQRLKPWPNQNWEEIETLLAERKAAGYRTIFGENGWIVLQRSK